MPEATVHDVDFTAERDRRRVAELDDATLVYVMLGLNGEMEGQPGWGKTVRARALARTVFEEIAHRWIPADVLAAACREILDEEASGDA